MRVRQRMVVSCDTRKNFQMALNHGVRVENTKPGSAFRKYMRKHERNGNDFAIAYNGFCYVVADDNVLVTVTVLPPKFKEVAALCQKEIEFMS